MDNAISLPEMQIKKLVEAMRPPAELRNQIDLGYSFERNVLELFEIRPSFIDPSKIDHHPVAKAKYVKTQEVWKIYWLRANGKWVAYEPNPEVDTIDEVFDVIEKDQHGCFFG